MRELNNSELKLVCGGAKVSIGLIRDLVGFGPGIKITPDKSGRFFRITDYGVPILRVFFPRRGPVIIA